MKSPYACDEPLCFMPAIHSFGVSVMNEVLVLPGHRDVKDRGGRAKQEELIPHDQSLCFKRPIHFSGDLAVESV